MFLPWMDPADLAPGDAKCASRDWAGFQLHPIRSATDPHFQTAYDALWQQFGAAGEMEQMDVVTRRLQWNPRQPVNGCALLYELLLVTHGEEFVAVRDHTAIVRPEFPMAVVHLSHNLVAPAWRRSGIAGWLRALPAQTARACLEAATQTPDAPIALVAEMEFSDPTNEPRTIRLTAYERAGYKKLDPAMVPYLQPDFRSPAAIDASGGPQPLPLSLLVRLVGDETRDAMAADDVRGIVESLAHMYAAEFRPADMAGIFANLAALPLGQASVPLIPPTA